MHWICIVWGCHFISHLMVCLIIVIHNLSHIKIQSEQTYHFFLRKRDWVWRRDLLSVFGPTINHNQGHSCREPPVTASGNKISLNLVFKSCFTGQVKQYRWKVNCTKIWVFFLIEIIKYLCNRFVRGIKQFNQLLLVSINSNFCLKSYSNCELCHTYSGEGSSTNLRIQSGCLTSIQTNRV